MTSLPVWWRHFRWPRSHVGRVGLEPTIKLGPRPQNDFPTRPGHVVQNPGFWLVEIWNPAISLVRSHTAPLFFFDWIWKRSGKICCNLLAIALDAIFTSTLISTEIGLPFLISRLSFFSSKVIIACFCELDNCPCSCAKFKDGVSKAFPHEVPEAKVKFYCQAIVSWCFGCLKGFQRLEIFIWWNFVIQESPLLICQYVSGYITKTFVSR